MLSIVLVGHPRLRNDLNRPTMEEISHRTTKFTFEGLGDERRAYLDWLIAGALAKDVDPALLRCKNTTFKINGLQVGLATFPDIKSSQSQDAADS